MLSNSLVTLWVRIFAPWHWLRHPPTFITQAFHILPLGVVVVIPQRSSPKLFASCPSLFRAKTFQNLTAVNPRRTTAKLSTFCPLASYFHGKHLETHSIALDFAKLNFNQSYIFKVNKPLVAPQPSYPHSALWHRIFTVKPLETHSIALDFALQINSIKPG